MPAKFPAFIHALEHARAALSASPPTSATSAAIAEIDRALALADEREPNVAALEREVERLEASQGLFPAVVNQSPQGIIICDAAGKLVFQNPAAQRIWAGTATADTVDGWGQFRGFHPDGRPYEATDWSMFRSLSKREITVAEEMHIQRFDGSRGVVLGSSAPIFAEGGVLLGAVSVFADISTSKELEGELRLSRARFATILTSIGDAVISTDAKGGITFMNAVAEQLTGWTADAAQTRPLREIFHIVNETSRAEVESPVDKVIASGGIVGLANHTVLIRKDGSEVHIDDSAAPIRDEAGSLDGVVLVFRDVGLKRLEEQRREFLVSASSMLAASMDPELTLATITRLAVPTLADWCSIEIGNVPGLSQQLAVAHVDPSKVELARELRLRYPPDPNAPIGVPNVLRTGKAELVSEVPAGLFESVVTDPEQLRLARELGLNTWMIVPLKAQGQILGAITFVGAHSDRRYAEADLAFAEELANCAALAISNSRLYQAETAAKEAALRAQKFEQELIGIVSHDLRNPLSAISVSAETLLREGASRPLTRIMTAAGRATRMIRDLLDLTQSRLGSGIPISRQPVDLKEVARQVLDEAHAANPDGVRVSSELLGDCTGHWDADRIAQALGNLLANAITYGDGAGVRLKATGVADGVVIEVHNRGAAIPTEKIATLFEPFTRGAGHDAGSATRSVGLGLYIVKQIIEAHRGTVAVRSDAADGTVITVRLPRGVS